MWMGIVVAKIYVCARDTWWHNDIIIQCPLPIPVAIAELCTDMTADAILVALPLRLLWRVKLPQNQRIMILSIFSSSILTSVVSVVHTAFLIPTSSFIGGITADVEGAVSLIVCNLLVIVTYLYRLFRGGSDIDSGYIHGTNKDSNSMSLETTTDRLTTIDLERLTAHSSQEMTASNFSSPPVTSGLHVRFE
ncbi:hypothetical protein SERLADRAFT_365484 [Serpula lacrymans var. lacrymans S7.9]|nr:uncharacterized protein SERLADRAFT_365484 [Serpula lacrymans var. lacrymans S7.9]EGO29462.1 hypothetical protein SERLADRAFT_365484 [Serpula lacrymans var. lacrymans S7.9]